MKGMVFTELLSMADAVVGEGVVDEVLESLDLESGGAYTGVGNYPCSELIAIVGALSERTGMPPEELQRQFGHWVFASFYRHYPQFVQDKAGALHMLASIESEVHVEVRKLYPEAELPTFETHCPAAGQMEMRYRSDRPLAAFCRGLIEACVTHFDEDITIRQAPGDGTCQAVFHLSQTL